MLENNSYQPRTSENSKAHISTKSTLDMNIVNFDAIKLRLASPYDILSWSYGEVTKPETINYRTQKAEKDGLFSERIFGPVKDYECSCGKYKRIRYKGIVCDKCGVEVTKSSVRRQRMGHIELAVPVAHIWYLRNIPGRISMILDKTISEIEKVAYYSSYIITSVNEDIKKDYLKQIEDEFKKKSKHLDDKQGKEKDSKTDELKDAKDKSVAMLSSLVKWNILSEVEYRTMSMTFGPVFKAETGSEVLREIFEKLDLKKMMVEMEEELANADGAKAQKIIRKMRFIGGLVKAGVEPAWMFLTRIPIIPPDLRPMVALDGGRFATSDLNDLYRRVINRNNRLKKLIELNAPNVIVRNEKRMLQEAVDALIDNSMRRGQSTTVASTGQKRALKSLADVLKGKRGRFRQNLLGKRVDYSGRSVIVVGPKLRIDECGIPKKMALELFKPFIIHRLIEEELAHNIRSATRLIEQGEDRVWDILDEVIEDKFVLLNRAPTLHRLSIQAFRPVLIEGKAIQLHPMVCSPFNADFDGDQMAVHVPLSKEAIKEAEELMLSVKNLIKPSDGAPASIPGQDMVLGIYYVTAMKPVEEGQAVKVYRDFKDSVFAYHHKEISLTEEIEVRHEDFVGGQPIRTTAGRILFNEILPKDFGFINELVDKKALKKIIKRALDEHSDQEVGILLDNIKDFGFHYMTRSGLSWAMSDFKTPEHKPEIVDKASKKVQMVYEQYMAGLLTKDERYSQAVEIWANATAEIGENVKKDIDVKGPVFSMIDSGARGSWSQLSQMSGMKGSVVSPSGKVIEVPITSSFVEGLSEIEYFTSTHGARKGLVDTALKTATSGYLTRRLVDVCQDIVVTQEDCHDTEGIWVYRKDAEVTDDNFENFVFGRYILEDVRDPETKELIIKSGDFVTREIAQKITRITSIQRLKVRSVVTCKTNRGVCRKCYGYDLGRNNEVKLGEAVGIITAQAIGEPGTQLTMRTFHFGGSAAAADVTKGLPRVEEVFEARTPKNFALVSNIDGVVVDIVDKGSSKHILVKEDVSAKTEDDKGTKKVKKASSKSKVEDFKYDPSIHIAKVKVGDVVKAGDPLTDGHLILSEVFEYAGLEGLTRYIVREILDIYNSQGAGINAKYVEMIVKQMTSRFTVTDSGSSTYLAGQIITRDQLMEYNNNISGDMKPIQIQLSLQGITKVALNTESFLSAASFQHTTKVLINASLFGKVDNLRGLKENVIIGRLIPAGTGLRTDFIEGGFRDLD